MSTNQQALADHWKAKAFASDLEKTVDQIAFFLNAFHRSTKYRLSEINSRVFLLERRLQMIEARMTTGGKEND